MARASIQVRGRLGAASEQRKAPWRELEGQVEMFPHRVDSEPEDGHFEESRIGYGDARFPEKRTDVEFDLVAATKHAIALGNRMQMPPALS